MTTETPPRGLTAAQLGLLLQPISPQRVRQHKNQSHVEAWDVRRWLTRIFGFGGWSDEILSCVLVHEVTWPIMEKGEPAPGKHRCTAVYRVTLRLTVRDQHGNEIGHWDDGATGDGINQVSVGDAHDLALKTAMSQALKRCAVNLGDQFGLSLYNKGSLAPAVLRTVAHGTLAPEQSADAQEDPPVEGGELDDEHIGPDDATETPRRTTPRDRLVQPRGDDPWEREPPPAAEPRRPTNKMLTALATLAGVKRGVGNNRDARLDLMRSFLPEPRRAQIRSGNDLTFDEAKHIIGLLENEPDRPPQEPVSEPNPRNGDTPVSAPVEAALSTRSPEEAAAKLAESDQVAADWAAAINGADSHAELDSIGRKISAAVQDGVLLDDHRRLLDATWRARKAQLPPPDRPPQDEGWSHRMMADRTGAPA